MSPDRMKTVAGEAITGGVALITGGAGFVGSHLADELLARGYRVRVLDNLSTQVHGESASRPAYLAPDVELVRGDIRDASAVRNALRGVDAVFHFAAAVGVGQSMYEIERYTDVNNRGTAVLLEALADAPVRRLVVASSMSVYGEGLYRTPAGEVVSAGERSYEQLKRGEWEVKADDGVLSPVATPETKPAEPSSVYALSKLDQERLCLMVGRAYGMSAVALRFFNIYGPRQALSNPYTGVLAIFASRFLNRRPPLIYEDGRQRRDFVHVRDVARACRLALETPQADGGVFNVGSGESRTIAGLAEEMAAALGVDDLPAEITGKFRVGDIRHCFADISHAERVLGYRPRTSLGEGLEELVEWMQGQRAFDRVEDAGAELARRGLQL
ncbi:NAD-dependent epimerase/dehydratase family protein [Luteimonas suaedae]|uniref:NAD-dependent epimerase/dehydratase family protein n=1 Tax=Luteimonas suaedae TaxID=2605430 RepID=UPI002106DA6C|nr:NAD-dependent epimerase/dehydratase family protein [Luteimonas suaedae]